MLGCRGDSVRARAPASRRLDLRRLGMLSHPVDEALERVKK